MAAWVFYVDALFGINPSGIGNWGIALSGLWIPAIVTFAAGYQSVYQALILVLAGVVLYAFLKARRETLGQVAAPQDNPAEPEPSASPPA